MAYYAIARELRDVTFSISRTTQRRGAAEDNGVRENNPSPYAFAGDGASLDVWGVNSTLSSYDFSLTLQLFSIQSGKLLSEVEIRAELLPNQSTKVLDKFDISKFDVSDVVASVSYGHPISGATLRSSADWPQPLKYISFPDREVEFSVDERTIFIRAQRPTKGIILDVEGDDDEGIVWSDNGFDIMPGEDVVIHTQGISGRKLVVNWYGEKENCRD